MEIYNQRKSYEGKIKEFFAYCKFLNDAADVKLEKNQFLSDSEINAGNSLDSEQDEIEDDSD